MDPGRVLTLFLLAFSSCVASPAPIEVSSGVALWRPTAPVPAGFTDFGLSATLESGAIVCRRRIDGDPIHYLTFEREGTRSGYGAYGLAGPKNGLPVARPLYGDPIAWPDRDEEQALAFLLELEGVDANSAAHFVQARGAELFARGLRVLFVVAPPWGAETTEGALPVVIVIELTPP